MVDHPVDSSGGNDGVAEIIAELFEVDIGGNDGRGFTISAIDNLVKETGVGGIMLFQAVKADFVYEQYFRGKKTLSFLSRLLSARPARSCLSIAAAVT